MLKLALIHVRYKVASNFLHRKKASKTLGKHQIRVFWNLENSQPDHSLSQYSESTSWHIRGKSPAPCPETAQP